ncbi:MAG: GGDEF domain-containing protein [Oscillospiraceae bacterium]|nr:GGDEF domain-containing protein [Oscillospiraceae bacterium]
MRLTDIFSNVLPASKKKGRSDVTFEYLAAALAQDYISIYYIDMMDNSYVEYATIGGSSRIRILNTGADFFKDTIINSRILVHKDDRPDFIKKLRKKNIISALEESKSFSVDYRLLIDGKEQYFNLKTISSPNDRKYVVIGVRNVDEQVRREQAQQKKQVIYDTVAKILATRYEVIYYVDCETNSYVEFAASEEHARLSAGAPGKDFFADTQVNMKSEIYAEDYPMMAAAMEKEHFLSEIEREGRMTLTYRLNIGDHAEYIRLFAIRAAQGDSHVVVAVTNVDASVRLETELKNAVTQANTDNLTGVKNKYAYSTAIKRINGEIAEKKAEPFAIAVFDVNGLKNINDSMGHTAGDEFIRSACRMICVSFAHSPVYRIGGDEFAVIARGNDYEHSGELMDKISHMVEENKKKGLVTIAGGISVYNRYTDTTAEKVFERADKEMYSVKKVMKSGKQ